MRRREFLAGIGFLAVSGCAGAPKSSRSGRLKDAIRSVEQITPDLMKDSGVPGAAIAIVQDGRLVWARGFGVKDVQANRPVDEETLFEAASVSKTVFAYAALKLCERGVIGLDTPLVRYTQKRFVEDPRLEKVTARNVLSHSSGFAEWRSKEGPIIRTEPGSIFDYSGEGYYYLQSVIAEVAGKVDRTQCATYEADFEVCATDFDEFMKRNLLRPFGLRHSGYLATQHSAGRVAKGHDGANKVITKGPPRGSDVARYGAVGGLNTSAAEYAKFLIEVVAPKPADDFRLSESSLKEMARPHIKLPKGVEIDGCTAWGLGWGIQERDGGNMLVHSGGQAGFRSLALASIERKSGFIIFTNSDNGGKVIYHPEMLQRADKVVMG